MSNDSQDILNIGAAIKTTWSFGFECFFQWKYYIVPSLCRIQYIKYCHSVEENNCSHFKANEGDNDWMSKGFYSHLFRLMHVYRTLWYFFYQPLWRSSGEWNEIRSSVWTQTRDFVTMYSSTTVLFLFCIFWAFCWSGGLQQ